MIGIVTGLRAEAQILSNLGHPVTFTGGNPAEAARTLAARGLSGLVSFGIATGLCPGLRPGTLVLASEIVTDSHRHQTSAPWRSRVARALPNAVEAPLAGMDSPPFTARHKAALKDRTGALAVDVESHAVAAIAEEFQIPLLVLRAVAAPAERNLPRAISGQELSTALKAGPIAAGLLRTPRQTAGMLRLALDFRRALMSLRHSAPLIAG